MKEILKILLTIASVMVLITVVILLWWLIIPILAMVWIAYMINPDEFKKEWNSKY